MSMRVVVRVRPSSDCVVQCAPHVSNHIATQHLPEGLEFSSVLGVESTQNEAFQCCGAPMIDAMLDGQQACLFAYGQTGSGKTFSLLGAEGGKNPHKLNGIVPLVVAELFRRFSALEAQGVKCKLSASFIEVVNETVRDLVDVPDRYGNQPVLGMRQTALGAVLVKRGTRQTGAKRVNVESSRTLLGVVEDALQKRVTDANDYHEHSSRSHALLTLTLEKRTGTTSQTTSIMMVDLAGSENYLDTRPHQKINVSLLALGRVLMALAQRQAYVPYRDSVLTRLLQGVMERGGSMCMLACIHPGAAYMGETNAVLEYAKTTASIVRSVVRAEIKDIRTPGQRGSAIDPMQYDEFDPDEEMMRRTEIIETKAHGCVHARCVGDAEDPLILYLHAPRPGCSSLDFNALVVGVADAMRNDRRRRPVASASSDALPLASQRGAAAGSGGRCTARKSSGVSPKAPPRAKAKLASPAEEKETPEEEEAQLQIATRFYHMRAHLSNALAACEAELSASRCDLCLSQLRRPSRLIGCRHVLCRLCAESSVLYWDECPVCGKTDSVAFTDSLHNAVLERREAEWRSAHAHKSGAGYAKLSGSTNSWSSRLDIATKERATTRRITICYGCEASAGPSERAKLTWYARAVDAAYRRQPGGESGRDAPSIHDVILNTTPSAPNVSEDCCVRAANHPQLGYTSSRVVLSLRAETIRCDITVRWDAAIGIPPVKIRAVSPRGELQFKRWLVVQLPPHASSLQSARLPPFVEVGDGLTCCPSGWVVFQTPRDLRIYFSARTFGRNAVGPSATPRGGVAPTSKPRHASPARARQDDDDDLTLAPLPPQALGQVKHVQRQLALTALAGKPLVEALHSRRVDGLKSAATAAEKERAAALQPAAAVQPAAGKGGSAEDGEEDGERAGLRSARRSYGQREFSLLRLLTPEAVAPASAEASGDEAAAPPPMFERSDPPPVRSSLGLEETLLRAAVSGTNVAVRNVFNQMAELAQSAAKTTCARLAQELSDSNEERQEDIRAFFQVAIDLPGYGLTEQGDSWGDPSDVLMDVLRSLGKTSAHALVGAEASGLFVLRAISERPALARFLALREPTAACDNLKLLTHVLQHVLVLSSTNGQKLQLARRLSDTLQQGRLVELDPKNRRGSAAFALHTFLKEVNAQTGAPPFRARKMPLLTRLAGGLHAWKGQPSALASKNVAKMREQYDRALSAGPPPDPVRLPPPPPKRIDASATPEPAWLPAPAGKEASHAPSSRKTSISEDSITSCDAMDARPNCNPADTSDAAPAAYSSSNVASEKPMDCAYEQDRTVSTKQILQPSGSDQQMMKRAGSKKLEVRKHSSGRALLSSAPVSPRG